MQLPTKKSVDEYLECDGYCPFCKSSHITAHGHPEIDNVIAWRDVRCDKCGKEWTDQYRLIAISIKTSDDTWYSDEAKYWKHPETLQKHYLHEPEYETRNSKPDS